MQQLQQQLPIPVVSGLPAIQASLEWADNSGVYVLGAYAALQLGPGALNLAGAKTASVVLVKQLQKQLGWGSPGSSSSRSSSSSKGAGKGLGRKDGSSASTASAAAATEADAGSEGSASRKRLQQQMMPAKIDTAAAAAAAAADHDETAPAPATVSAADAGTSKDGSSSSSSQTVTPCTALKGKDAVFLAGVVTHGGRAMYNKAAAGHHLYGPYSGPECCGSCWKSRHVASRARWGGAAAASSAGSHHRS
jgi:hypothetical protein